MLEYFIETLMYGVQDHCQDELVVILVSQDIDGHVSVASEYGDIVLYRHDIILVNVEGLGGSFFAGAGSCAALLVGLEKESLFKLSLLAIGLKPPWQVVVLSDNSLALVVQHDDTFHVAYHTFQHLYIIIFF